MHYRLGCDIGGTFTDFAVLDTGTGVVVTHKRLTTPAAPAEAIEAGLRVLAARLPDLLARAVVVHGTTLVVNAVIERKGARTALVTTEGFRDVLEIGREGRFDQYDIWLRFPRPIVPRPLRFEVAERMHAGGAVLTELSDAALRDLVGRVLAAEVEAVAICLLHSYRNPAHERRIAQALRDSNAALAVSLSAEVAQEIGEYERSCTTAVNAYTQPLTEQYLADLQRRLAGLGFAGDLLVTLSTGGVTSVETARAFPVRIMESGPAAGAIAAAHYAGLLGMDQLVAFDMGGTTAKIALISEGRLATTDMCEVDRTYRFKRGSGIPVRAPMLDLIEIGAGGGSIARVTGTGTIQVGPDSAGAVPGPACYAGGGTLPTVTDANAVLGYLDPAYFLGGEMRLDIALAERAIRGIADRLGMGVLDAAFGIHAVVNENMASAAKVHLAEKGIDPASCALFAFGGGGPVHAMDLMRRMGITRAVVPPHSGVASAFGMSVAPVSYDVGRAFRCVLSDLDFTALEQEFVRLEQAARARLPRSVPAEQVAVARSLEMRYLGQGYQVGVALADRAAHGAAAVEALFNTVYHRLYGRVDADQPIELVGLRVHLDAGRVASPPPPLPADGTLSSARRRPAWCAATGAMIPHAIHRRAELPRGVRLRGPAIVEEVDTSIVIAAGGEAELSDTGCLVITLDAF